VSTIRFLRLPACAIDVHAVKYAKVYLSMRSGESWWRPRASQKLFIVRQSQGGMFLPDNFSSTFTIARRDRSKKRSMFGSAVRLGGGAAVDVDNGKWGTVRRETEKMRDEGKAARVNRGSLDWPQVGVWAGQYQECWMVEQSVKASVEARR
jgi:hypothetical protein